MGGIGMNLATYMSMAEAGQVESRGKAKAGIFVNLNGGPTHIDTFDPKPKLKEMHLKKFQRQSKFLSAMGSGERYYVQSPFGFRKAGQSGIDLCEHWEHLAGVADELCVYRGCQAESITSRS